MEGEPVNRWRWHALRMHDALGWHGVAGVTLLVLSAAFFVLVLAPLEARLALVRAAPQPAGPGTVQAEPVLDSAQALRSRLDLFYAYLDSGKTLEDQLAAVHAAAVASGLTLKRGDYRLVDATAGRVRRYEANFPVTGTYAQVRHFVNVVLGSVPIAALQSITFQKKQIADTNVEAEIVWRFYLGKPR